MEVTGAMTYVKQRSALIASYWGPDFVWVIVLYCGYKLRKLLEKMPLLALVTIYVVIVSLFLATQ